MAPCQYYDTVRAYGSSRQKPARVHPFSCRALPFGLTYRAAQKIYASRDIRTLNCGQARQITAIKGEPHLQESPNYNNLIRYYTKPDIMDRYMLVILALMIGGMVIMASQQRWAVFYAMMGGAIVVIMYSSWRNRRQYKRKK